METDPGQPRTTAGVETADAERQSIPARLGGMVRSAYEAFQDRRERNQAKLAIAVALSGGLAGATAVELAYGATPAGANSGDTIAKPSSLPTSNCVQYSPAVSPGYVNHAVRPLAAQVLEDYRSAKSKNKQREATSEMADLSYSKITEISVEDRSRSKISHRMGEYLVQADFYPRGHLKPGNMVAVNIEELNKTFKPPYWKNGEEIKAIYDFFLARTTREPLGNFLGSHWDLDVQYTYKGASYSASSTVPSKAEIGGSHAMTKDALNAFDSQAQDIIQKAEKHKAMQLEQNLASTYQAVNICP